MNCFHYQYTQAKSKTYTYSSNRNNTILEWIVLSGSISIGSGKNSNTVTVQFKEGSTSGRIKCDASGDLVCDAFININQ